MHTYTHTYTDTYKYTHTHMHTYIHTHTYIHIHRILVSNLAADAHSPSLVETVHVETESLIGNGCVVDTRVSMAKTVALCKAKPVYLAPL